MRGQPAGVGFMTQRGTLPPSGSQSIPPSSLPLRLWRQPHHERIEAARARFTGPDAIRDARDGDATAMEGLAGIREVTLARADLSSGERIAGAVVFLHVDVLEACQRLAWQSAEGVAAQVDVSGRVDVSAEAAVIAVGAELPRPLLGT